MSWQVVSPVLAARHVTIVVNIDIPFFSDEIEYEEILGRAFSSPADQDRLASGVLIVLATEEGAGQMKLIKDTKLDVPIPEALAKLALRRQIVALRWLP